MINLIQAGINQGKIAYDPNTVYAIFTGSGVNLGGGFGSQYCAYHTRTARRRGADAYYSRRCRTTSSIRRRLHVGARVAERRRRGPTRRSTPSRTRSRRRRPTRCGNAWYDNRGYENADKCAWTWGTTYTAANGGKHNMKLSDGKHYLIQQNWVNAGSGGCALSLTNA